MEQDDKFMLYSEKFNMEAEHMGKYSICFIFFPIFVKRVVLFFNTVQCNLNNMININAVLQ